MSSSRQLAAIMFTDIDGYTTLMGNDEQKAEFIQPDHRFQPLLKRLNLPD